MPLTNHYKFLKMSGSINFQSNNFGMILMKDTYVFNQDDHEDANDISGMELPSGNGYSTAVMVLDSLVEDDVNDRAEAIFQDVEWTASGGNIGPAAGAMIIKSDGGIMPLIGYIDFGTPQTATDGGVFRITNIKIRES
jgi:hypothetical protein